LEIECGVRTLTTAKARAGTRPAVSLHRRNAIEDETGTHVTLFTVEMNVIRLKTDAKSKTASNRNDTMRETIIIMVPSITSLTDNVPRKEDAINDERLVPDLLRGRGRSIGDLDVGEEDSEQTIVTMQSLDHNSVSYQHVRTRLDLIKKAYPCKCNREHKQERERM
jgi:hypothetical protein